MPCWIVVVNCPRYFGGEISEMYMGDNTDEPPIEIPLMKGTRNTPEAAIKVQWNSFFFTKMN